MMVSDTINDGRLASNIIDGNCIYTIIDGSDMASEMALIWQVKWH